jgi:hypothetical protein
MNLQEKLTDVARVADIARARLTTSWRILDGARQQLRRVAGRHAARFVRQNSTLFQHAGSDISDLARETYATLRSKKAQPRTPRRTTVRVRKSS